MPSGWVCTPGSEEWFEEWPSNVRKWFKDGTKPNGYPGLRTPVARRTAMS